MQDHKNWAEEQRRSEKIRSSKIGDIVMLVVYLVAGFWFYQMWGWWGVVIAIPVAWIAGGVLAVMVTSTIYKK